MFIEDRLLDCVSYGTVYGERFRTSVKTMRNKEESRLIEWSESQGTFSLVFAALTEPDRAEVMRVFRAVRGRGIGFRLKNWVDFKAVDQLIGIGTGADQVLQLKITSSAGAYSTVKTIKKPVTGTVTIYIDGVATAAIIDYTTGLVTITAPLGAAIAWSGEYDIPVRFDTDDIMWSVDNKANGVFVMGSDVPVVEL